MCRNRRWNQDNFQFNLSKGIREIESSPLGSRQEQRGEITIGEALEATALTAGNRPIDYSDAAAIQAAEVRATGRTNIVPGGVAAAAQSAATRNARLPKDEEKTKLGDILSVCYILLFVFYDVGNKENRKEL